MFTEAPILLMPDKIKAFTIESDAFKFTIKVVLRQTDINSDLYPCGYLSQSLNTVQWNYEVYDQKLLKIVKALEEWQHYLDGNPFPTQILFDHQTLIYFCNAQKLNYRQA